MGRGLNWRTEEGTQRALLRLTRAANAVRDAYPLIGWGGCAIFAKVAYDITSLPPAGVFDSGASATCAPLEVGLPRGCGPVHVVVGLPTGDFYDSFGVIAEEQLLEEFTAEVPPLGKWYVEMSHYPRLFPWVVAMCESWRKEEKQIRQVFIAGLK